jgi:predicted DNA-binding WGR domain protein
MRYYNLDMYKTLFGDFCIERVYGSCSNMNPTGIKRNFYTDFETAKKDFLKLSADKTKKGYHKNNIQNIVCSA